ncbi:MAG: ATP-binding protein [Desulfovibrionaceae bacterium]
MRLWHLGIISTALVALALTALSHVGVKIPNPVLIFTLCIVVSAYHGGYVPGLVSTAITFAFVLVDWSSPGGLFQYTARDATRLLVFVATVPLMSLLVSQLHGRKRKAIEQVTAYAKELRAGEARLVRAELVAGTGNWDVDLATGRLATSPGARRIYGIDETYDTFESVKGVPLPEHRAELDAVLQRLLVDDESYSLEFRIRRPRDGAIVDIYSRAAFDRRENKIFGIIQDITERKRIESKLRDALTKADSANKAKTLFLANMSHEIRTPLGGVLGMLQLLQDEVRDPAQAAQVAAAIQSSRRLTGLLSDILDISRIEAGKMPVLRRAFRLPDLKDAARDLFRQKIEQNRNTLEFHVAPEVPEWVVGDEGKVRQVLFNLMDNALKFTSDGVVSVSITALPGCGDACRVLFVVSDTGDGMSDELLKNVFESFVQGDSSFVKRHQGVGLGLAIVRRLVELLGGALCVESEVGRGSSFYLSLPFERGGEPREADDAGRKPPAPAPSAPRRILVADDDNVTRLASQGILKRAGHVVVCATDGREALEKLRQSDFDMILMDIQMPVMDGVEAARIIRTDPQYAAVRDIPIVAVTAYAMPGDRTMFLDSGFSDYIAKPFDKQELLHKVDAAVSGGPEIGPGTGPGTGPDPAG